MTARKFLTMREVEGLIEVLQDGMTGPRDCCLILLAFRHGFRISELLNLNFRDLDLDEGRIYIRRLKNGLSTIHPLMKDELQALRKWKEERVAWKADSEPERVFISRRGSRLSRQQAWRIISQAGEKAGTVIGTYPHMLRHACGYELAERGTDTRLIQDYLGHRNIRHTVRYTAGNAARFAGIWEKENILDRNNNFRDVQKTD